MAKKLKIKSPLDAADCSGFFIVNDFDRPDEERIAGKGKDGKFYYIHPSLRDVKLYHDMTPTNPTPLEDFGIRWMVDGFRLAKEPDREGCPKCARGGWKTVKGVKRCLLCGHEWESPENEKCPSVGAKEK